jgi:hypothetical protein
MKVKVIDLLKVTTLFSLLFLSPTATAGDKDERSASEDWVPVKHLCFTDEDIQGGTTDPDGVLIESIKPATHSSLIEIREGFEAEIVKTMENF